MQATPPSSRLNRWVHLSLLTGVVVSGILLTIGLVLTLFTGQPAAVNPHPAWRAIIAQALVGDPIAILELGLLALMATPVVRVIVLAVGWLAEGEFRFAGIAFTVFVLLVVSALIGGAG